MMNRRWMLVVALGLVLFAVGCDTTPKVTKEKYDRDINDLSRRIQDLKQENNDLAAQLTGAQVELGKRQGPDVSDIRSVIGSEGDVTLVNGIPTITMKSDIVFGSGQATLKAGAQNTLRRLVDLIRSKHPSVGIIVAGHTDNQPIKRTRKLYKTNWELSATRALNVMHFMISAGIPPARIQAAACGEFKPIAPNTTKAGRAKNRRVEIMLVGFK